MSEKRSGKNSESEKRSKKVKKATKPDEPKPSTNNDESLNNDLFNSNDSDFESEDETSKIYKVSELQKDVNKLSINGVIIEAIIISSHDLVKLSLRDKETAVSIQVICWDLKFFENVKIGHEITIYNAYIKTIKEQYLSKKTCSSIYEISIASESTFKIHGYSNLKSLEYTKFEQLKSLPVYKLVNVKGRVSKILVESNSKNSFVLSLKSNLITVHLNECFNVKDLILNAKILLIGLSIRKFKNEIFFHGNVFSSVFQKK